MHWRFQALAVAVFLGFVLLAGAPAVAGDAPLSPLDEDGKLVQFQRDIAPILRNHCLECHGPEEAKNGFRVDDRETFLFYVEPGDGEFSTVFLDYLAASDETMLMPPPSHGGPLSPDELALIRVWIDEGAEWPEDAKVVPEPTEAAIEKVAASNAAPASERLPATLIQRVWSFQGFLHPATVHFPIALLLIGGLFVVLGVKWPAIGTQVPLACLLIGAATAIASTTMGWSFAVERGYGGWTKVDLDSEIFWHRWSGLVVTVLSSFLAVVAVVSVARRKTWLTPVWKGGLVLVAMLVGLVGHQGGEMTYGPDHYPKAFRVLLGQTEQPAEPATKDDTDGAGQGTGGSPRNVAASSSEIPDPAG